VVFGRADGGGLLQGGSLVNISADGLRVATRRPAPLAGEVDLDVDQGDEGATPVRARVAHVTSLGGGDYAMGLRTFRLRGGEPPVVETQQANRPQVQGRQAQEPRVATSRASKREDHRRIPWILAAVFMVASFVMIIMLLPGHSPVGEKAVSISGVVTASAPPLPVLSDVPPVGGSGTGTTSGGPAFPRDGDFESVEATFAPREIARGSLAPMAALGDRPVGSTPLGAGDRAPDEPSGGQPPIATRRVELAVAFDSSLGAHQRGVGFAGNHADSKPSSQGFTNVRGESLGLMLDRNGGGGMNRADAPRIELDLAAFTMTLFRGDTPLRRFPVGIGRGDATPAGTFRIANKISNPAWYNRGAVVPAGDAGNPIGARWMALGEDGVKATSYGIHPTPNSGSIGQPMSRGCIRMRPDDAESVFRLCPVGTPVEIRR
jgi:L,D-transpeptidase-like protein